MLYLFQRTTGCIRSQSSPIKERWFCVLYRFEVSLSMVISCVSETSNLAVMLRPMEAANPPSIVPFTVQYLHCEHCSHYPPAGLHTQNCACSHCTSTSPSGLMCKTPLPRKDHLLQSWCPYNPLPPDAALVGRNLCSNPSRATR